MDKGIYCLVFSTRGSAVRVGALGDISFAAGWYVYVGSALGSGGLKRLDRHIALFASKDKRPKWHVDYLLTDPGFKLRYAISAATRVRLECELARLVGGAGVPAFGCSDCSCMTHLSYRKQNPHPELVAAFKGLGLEPSTKSIMRQEAQG